MFDPLLELVRRANEFVLGLRSRAAPVGGLTRLPTRAELAAERARRAACGSAR